MTRDFSQTYKNSITEALPNAKQIVDRFHIFKNLTDHIIDYLKRTIKNTIKIIEGSNDEEQILNERQRKKKETANRRKELALQIQKLLKEGKSKKEISKILKVCRPVVIKYSNPMECFETSTNCILDPYIPLIKELIIKENKIDEIYIKIKEAGYKGKTSLLNSRLRGIRQEIRTNTRYLKRSQIKKLLFKDIEEIKDNNLKKDLKMYLKTNSELTVIIDMIKDFKEIIFSKKPERLDKWLEEAKRINVTELNSFITLIQSDIDAVKNAIIYTYSNGLTEGFNNKTKVIKRIMYGRCSFELLRLKILS